MRQFYGGQRILYGSDHTVAPVTRTLGPQHVHPPAIISIEIKQCLYDLLLCVVLVEEHAGYEATRAIAIKSVADTLSSLCNVGWFS